MAGTGNPDWTKGVSGNPNGRPVGAKNFTTKVREALEALSEGKDISYEKQLIQSILDNAIVKKDITAQKLIWNYLDGMPQQRTELSGADGQPLIVKIDSEIANKYGTNPSPEENSSGQT